MIIFYGVLTALVVVLIATATSIRVVGRFERGVVFRLGRVRPGAHDPGLVMVMPIVDRLRTVNMQVIVMPVPAQDGITRDNVTVRVDAVISFSVIDPVRATVGQLDYVEATSQVAQTSLRSIIGKSDLDHLLSHRERLNRATKLMLDTPARTWGVQVERVEIKNVQGHPCAPTEHPTRE